MTHRTICLLVALCLMSSTSAVFAGTLQVTVRNADGSAAWGAAVCVGTSQSLNQFDQGTADSNGRVFLDVASTSFRVTASLGGHGQQRDMTAFSSLAFASLTLPAEAGGAACPRPLSATSLTIDRDAILAGFTPVAFPTPGIIRLGTAEFCFGAIGMACGQPQGIMPPAALCRDGRCLINGGSWVHDECCHAHPRGVACGGADTFTGGDDGNCGAEWDKAVRLTRKGLMWQRDENFTLANTTGNVSFNLYCAPPNTLLNFEDARRCCSGSTRSLTPAEATAAAAALEILTACR